MKRALIILGFVLTAMVMFAVGAVFGAWDTVRTGGRTHAAIAASREDMANSFLTGYYSGSAKALLGMADQSYTYKSFSAWGEKAGTAIREGHTRELESMFDQLHKEQAAVAQDLLGDTNL